jgi:tRNA-2-methylthio-N6-dimethylallyladenosine synthase
MRRGYTRDEYRERIARLRDHCPDIALSTDIIVGFPGETNPEFEATLEILREIEYDDAYLFMYSPRPQTLSAKIYEDDVPEGSKRLRLQQVQALQGEISLRKNLSMVGSAEEVLFEGEAKLGHPKIRGRTRRNKMVNAAGPVELVGTTARVRITGASANSLLGDLVGQAELSERTEQRGMAS